MFILLFDISIGKGLAVMGEKSRKICDQIRPVFFSELLGKRFPLAKGRPLSSLYRKHYGPFFLMLSLNQLIATWKMPSQAESVISAIAGKVQRNSLNYLRNERYIRVYNNQGKMWRASGQSIQLTTSETDSILAIWL